MQNDGSLKMQSGKQYQGSQMNSKNNESSELLLTTDDKELWVVTKYDGEEDRVVLLQICMYLLLSGSSSSVEIDRGRGCVKCAVMHTRKNQSAQPLTLPWHRCKQGSIRGNSSHPFQASRIPNS